MGTTPGAIRDELMARIAALTPLVHTRHRYVPWREDGSIRDWAARAPSACLRRVTIEAEGNTSEPVVSSTIFERVHEAMSIVVCYPDDLREQSGPGLDKMIDSDLELLTSRIGTRGSSLNPVLPGTGTWVVSGDWYRDRATSGVVFGVIPLTDVSYLRTPP